MSNRGRFEVVCYLGIVSSTSHNNKDYIIPMTDCIAQYIPLPVSCPWWRHQMETFSALLALCTGNSPALVNSSHKGQWCGALMFSLICAWISGWANNLEAGDLRRHRGHYDVTVMSHNNKDCIIPLTDCIAQNISLPVSCPWWRHQMETFSALLVICTGNSPVPVNSPHKASDAELWCFLWFVP